jgi:hypothetical protein
MSAYEFTEQEARELNHMEALKAEGKTSFQIFGHRLSLANGDDAQNHPRC